MWLLILVVVVVVDVCLNKNNLFNLNPVAVECMTLTNWSTLTTTSGLHESIVMPTMDTHKEAQRLYDEALKQHLGTISTLKELCEPWQRIGCHCSGLVERLVLSCRSIGITNFSRMTFPETLIKL